MTPREAMLEALLVERFRSPERRRMATSNPSVADIRAAHNDDELATYTRRKSLQDALQLDNFSPRTEAI